MRKWICAGSKGKAPCKWTCEQPEGVNAVGHACGVGKRATPMKLAPVEPTHDCAGCGQWAVKAAGDLCPDCQALM